ncbi:MAG TPA: MFS transporter [Acidimicrobiia bacterium]|nr:MFS transporter [Acidimicrobiia bacterium]
MVVVVVEGGTLVVVEDVVLTTLDVDASANVVVTIEVKVDWAARLDSFEPSSAHADMTTVAAMTRTNRRNIELTLEASTNNPSGYAPLVSARNDRQALRAWAMYDWANSAYVTVVAGAVLPAFFVSTVVPGDSYRLFGREWAADGLWGLVAGFGPLVMFLVIPVLGAIADFSASKKKFLSGFALIGSIFTILLFFAAPGRVGATIGIFLVAQMGFVGANVFYDGFLPDLTSDDTIDRESSRGYALGYVGGGLYLLLGVGLIFAEPFGAELTTRIVLAGAGIWWIGFSLWSIPRIPETGISQPLPERLRHLPRPNAYLRIGFGRTLATARRLRHFPQLLLFVIAFILYNDGVQTTINISSAYAGSTLELDLTVIVLAFLIVQFIAYFGALGFGRLSYALGIKRALLISLVVWTSVALAAFFLPTGAPIPFLGLAAVIGFVLGGVQALSRSLYGSMIPAEASAEFYGFYSVFSKFSAIWGPFLFAFIGAVTGSSRYAILSLVFFFAVGGFLLWRVDIAAARASRARWSFESEQASVR